MEGSLKCLGHDACTGRLVGAETLTGGPGSVLGTQQGDATTGDDTFLDGRLRGAHRILDAVLLLLQLHLRGSADLQDGHATGELRQTFLELLAVVVGVGVLDLALDLGDATGDLSLVAGALDDGGLVLGDHDLAGLAQHVERDGIDLEADLLGDDLATCEDRHVLQHRLATIAEAGGLDGHRREGAADLVDHQGGEGLALDVLGDDDQRTVGLHDLLEGRDQVTDRCDLGTREQHVRVLQDSLHAVGVGHEVGRDVALVETHALDQVHLHAEGLTLLDGDDAVPAHLVDGVGDHLADLGVARRDGGDIGDLALVAGHVLG